MLESELRFRFQAQNGDLKGSGISGTECGNASLRGACVNFLALKYYSTYTQPCAVSFLVRIREALGTICDSFQILTKEASMSEHIVQA